MSTQVAKQSDIQRKWFVLDLDGKVLGRAATEVARILRGKHWGIPAKTSSRRGNRERSGAASPGIFFSF